MSKPVRLDPDRVSDSFLINEIVRILDNERDFHERMRRCGRARVGNAGDPVTSPLSYYLRAMLAVKLRLVLPKEQCYIVFGTLMYRHRVLITTEPPEAPHLPSWVVALEELWGAHRGPISGEEVCRLMLQVRREAAHALLERLRAEREQVPSPLPTRVQES